MPTWSFEARDKLGKPARGSREAASRQEVLQALRDEGYFVTRLEVSRASARPSAAHLGGAGATKSAAAPQAQPAAARAASVPVPRAPATPSQPASSPGNPSTSGPTPPGPAGPVAGSASLPSDFRVESSGIKLRRKVSAPIGSRERASLAEAMAPEVPLPPRAGVHLVNGVAVAEAEPASAHVPVAYVRPAAGPVPVSTSADPSRTASHTGVAPLPTRWFLRASGRDLALYFRQIAAMADAGTSLGQAMHTLAENASRPSLRQASREMQERVMAGETLSSSMKAFPGLFSNLQMGMVMAGERGGSLDRTFERLARYSERDYDLQQTIKRETFFPKLQLWASIFIPGMVPLVVGFVQHGDPWGGFLRVVGPPTLGILAVIAVYRALSLAGPLTARGGSPRFLIDRAKLSVPIVGKVVRGLAISKFCRALGALNAAGVGPGESVRLAAHACGNAAIGTAALGTIPLLERGEGLTKSLGETGYFPGIALQMLRTGEETGKLDEQLDKAADFMEMDAETAIRQAVQVLPVLLLLLVGAIILKQAITFYTGYFNNIFAAADG